MALAFSRCSMAQSEDRSLLKAEKGSPPREDQVNNHFDSNWTDTQLLAADILRLQASNGPGVPLPPPYLNSLAAGYDVSPFHLWASQQITLPPHGIPYPATHSQNVNAHSTDPSFTVPSTMELLSFSSQNIQKCSSESFKELDEPAVQVGCGNSGDDSEGSVHKEL